MLQKILLSNFRNFEEKLVEFSPDTTIIVGPNATGKTNLLESIFLLATGKSFKARIGEEMINYRQDLARVKGRIESDTVLEVVLTRGAKLGEKVPKKKLLLNGVAKRLVDFAASFNIVLFRPEDMDLVSASPSIRRNFLDTLLSQSDKEYARSLLSYEKGLRRRNRLLVRIREEGLPRSQLMFWDKLLIKNGDFISQSRGEFVDYLNSNKKVDGIEFQVVYDKSAISEARLMEYAKEEVYAGTTLVGPHRDDIVFQIREEGRENKDFVDLAKYGSRGESRMGVLWAKLAELRFLEEKSGSKPTLLLDDIFSELDHLHREIVMKETKDNQTIITTADPHFIEDSKEVAIIELKG